VRKLQANSKQGYNIAFIGLNHTAQIACAEYLKRTHAFKRINMDDALKKFLKTSYWYKVKQNMDWKTKLEFYDAVYKVDSDIFIKYIEGRMALTSVDTVIYDVRYLNEMKALQDMGFIICRVTTPVKELQVGKYVKSAAVGSVGLSIAYDKRFSINNNANFVVNWTSKGTTGTIIEAFLDRIGYQT
jgi:hypothetical protein